MNQDIRWIQRFSNFRKALKKLKTGIEIINEYQIEENDEIIFETSKILKEGLIQRFEYTHELAWNVMKDYAEYQGNNAVKGSRDATREAFVMKLITNAEIWMDMIKARNETSHTYNEETADDILNKIITEYFPVFEIFEKNMEELITGKQTSIFDKDL